MENITRCKMKSKGKCLRTSACQTNIFVDFFLSECTYTEYYNVFHVLNLLDMFMGEMSHRQAFACSCTQYIFLFHFQTGGKSIPNSVSVLDAGARNPQKCVASCVGKKFHQKAINCDLCSA